MGAVMPSTPTGGLNQKALKKPFDGRFSFEGLEKNLGGVEGLALGGVVDLVAA